MRVTIDTTARYYLAALECMGNDWARGDWHHYIITVQDLSTDNGRVSSR